MSTYKWFCLALRVLGAWSVYYSLGDFVAEFNEIKGFYSPGYTTPFGFFLQGITHLAVGLLLMRYAPLIARFAYPKKTPARTMPREDADAI
ncbi:hypothetical protein [Oleiagrimonas soli]|uniref:Uncharacterized protein n=1 Tax=Oleiagrimonas soli TaxID=1543381 RepID=A0A099CVB2_9GAMM|nr:hypothetical protein [Oleiagrimonas soli]KGI77517.1 hypothetical protein LF63_0109270 [Oleiagrimonas soli]MBB6183015.1 hypothetical protein [Oleiagrimonas soli]